MTARYVVRYAAASTDELQAAIDEASRLVQRDRVSRVVVQACSEVVATNALQVAVRPPMEVAHAPA